MVHVTMDPLDSSTFVSRVSPVENAPICIEACNVKHVGVHERRTQHAVAASDIQDT